MKTAFPKLLSSQIAFDIARTVLDGFDKHYRLFRSASIAGKAFFEQSDWRGMQQSGRRQVDDGNQAAGIYRDHPGRHA